MKSTLKLTLLLGAAVATMNVAAVAGPGMQNFPRHVKTKEEAMECCKAGARVAKPPAPPSVFDRRLTVV